MEIKWCILDRTYRNDWNEAQNAWTLTMTATKMIEVQEKNQLFRYTHEVKQPNNIKDCIAIFTERATEYFKRIEEALKAELSPEITN